MQSLTHIIPQQPYLPQAVFMYNKLKQLKHKQLNKPQRLQQQLNNSNITNRYKDNDRLKPNRDYNKKLKRFATALFFLALETLFIIFLSQLSIRLVYLSLV